MGDKFHIGQPVWWMDRPHGTFKAVVTSSLMDSEFRDGLGKPYQKGKVYDLDSPERGPVPEGDATWCAFEHELAPRDPDQFLLADEAFEWRNKELA